MQEQHRWVADLTKEDAAWMSQLPFTLRLGSTLCIVHAGLVPGWFRAAIALTSPIRKRLRKFPFHGPGRLCLMGNFAHGVDDVMAWRDVGHR